MITLSKTKTVSIEYKECRVDAVIKYLSAEEVDQAVTDKIDNNTLFKQYVEKISSPDIEGWQDGIDPKSVPSLPGTYNIVADIAAEIFNSAFLTKKEKN